MSNRAEIYKWFIEKFGPHATVSFGQLGNTVFDYGLRWTEEHNDGYLIRNAVNETITLTDAGRELGGHLLTKQYIWREQLREQLNSANSPYESRSYKRDNRERTKRNWTKHKAYLSADARTAEGLKAIYTYFDDRISSPWYDRETYNAVNKRMPDEWQMISRIALVKLAGGAFSPADHVGWVVHWFHKLHVSTEDPAQVAYYPTVKHIKEDRVVRTRLGKYLATYKDFFGIDDATVKKMVDQYQANLMREKDITLRYAPHNDPDQWEYVYDNGPNSCMQGESAVRVYAHSQSQLRLAYLTDGDDDIIARCIVRCSDLGASESEHGWLRVYPDPDSDKAGKLLLTMLKDAGYANRINLDGAKLSLVREHGRIVCPYIDYGDGGTQSAKPDGDYLVLGEGADATNTNGYLEDDGRECDDCGDYFDEGDMTWVNDGDRCVCESCLHENYELAHTRYGREWRSRDDLIYCEDDEEYYTEAGAERHDVVYCEYNREYYFGHNIVSTFGGYVHIDDAVILDFEDSDGNRYAWPGDAKELPDGKMCHEDDYDRIMAEDYSTEEETSDIV